MIPGLLYFELAFDVQRSILLEFIICLLPSSAATLVLKSICSAEALSNPIDWLNEAPVTRTPLFHYDIFLFFDIILYSLLSFYLSKRKMKFLVKQTLLEKEINLSSNSFESFEIEKNTYDNSDKVSNLFFNYFSESIAYLQNVIKGIIFKIFRIPTYDSIPCTNENTMDDKQFSNKYEGKAAMRLKCLCKSYKNNGENTLVLSNLNTVLMDSKITVLLGSNGAGTVDIISCNNCLITYCIMLQVIYYINLQFSR